MIQNKAISQVDDDTITEVSYTNNNDSYDDLIVGIDNRSTMNSSLGSKISHQNDCQF